MAFDIDYLEDQLDSGIDATKHLVTSGQELSLSIKLLLMKLLVKALMSKSNFDAAILMANELLQDAPDSVYPHYALGTAFSKTGKNDKAVYHCRRFLEIAPIACDAKFKQDNLATVQNNLAVSLKTLGFLDQAEIEFKKALRLDDQFAAAYNNYGNLLNDKARLIEARQCFMRAIEINPEDHIAYWNLHSTAENMSEAQSIVETCVSKSPTDEIAIFTLAGLRAFNGDKRALKELIDYGFSNEPLVRSIEWILSLPRMPEIHFNRWSIYDRAIELSDQSRSFYEFGVWMGDSFRYLVPHFERGYGFDSFQGLPEDWGVVPRGTYSSRGRVPDIKNAKFVVGEFATTLPEFFDSKRPMAGLINFDADLYSSTIAALTNAKQVIDVNTILVFDEFIVNDRWEEDEFKALNEFCEANGFSYEVIAASLFTKQVICRLTKI
ncbi:tetratricopeptide repeat protein [Alphaproteobacteria bacterium LSUCC0719]